MSDKVYLYSQRKSYTPFTHEEIKAILDTADTQEAVFWGRELVVSYRLTPSLSIVGIGYCNCPDNFDIKALRLLAREYAEQMFLKQEGYSNNFLDT